MYSYSGSTMWTKCEVWILSTVFPFVRTPLATQWLYVYLFISHFSQGVNIVRLKAIEAKISIRTLWLSLIHCYSILSIEEIV